MSQLISIQDQLLSNVSSMHVPDGYISEMLLPQVLVGQKTGKFGKYGSQHLAIESSYVGGRGAYRRVEPIVRSLSTFSIESHGLEGMVTKDDYRNVQKPFDAEADEVIGLTTQLWNEKEKVLADAISSTSTLTQNTTLSGTSQLSDYSNSTPMTVFSTARAAVRSGCGKAPDCAWMDWGTKNILRYHPQLLEMLGFKYDKPGGLNDQDLANALDVKRILIADVVYNSAAEGQTAVLAPIWGKHIWFGVCPSAAQVRQVSLGYRLGMQGESPRKVTKAPIVNPPGSNSIIVEDEYQFFLTNVLAAYLIKDAVA